ncbi:relaxase/mobilization nuclease-like protein [Bacteroides zoogleoformans]|nr:relaxase/mobilization nuclease domain-containing protein [Bacteroides zoogleoformans]TWJ13346.1 relaxase/mobilization nuclease-like protein [Bacteroides zoogleoformans]
MMTKIALEYMEMMGIKDTQFLLVRHHDNDNPHCHLVYNRIDYHGKTITDQNDFRRNEKVTKRLKDKCGLTYGTGKAKTKTRRLRGAERTKYEIYHVVGKALMTCTSLKEFNQRLAQDGVKLELVMRKSGSRDLNDAQGMRFTKDGRNFKASQIRRGPTFQFVLSKLNTNAEKERKKQVYQNTISHNEQSRQETVSESACRSEASIVVPSLGLFDTTNPASTLQKKSFADGCSVRSDAGQGYNATTAGILLPCGCCFFL